MSSVETIRRETQLAKAIANDNYIRFVSGKLARGDVINHPVEDWQAEMIRHAEEKFPGASRQGIDFGIEAAAILVRAEASNG